MDSNDDIRVYVRNGDLSGKSRKRGCIAVAPTYVVISEKAGEQITPPSKEKIELNTINENRIKPIIETVSDRAKTLLSLLGIKIKQAWSDLQGMQIVKKLKKTATYLTVHRKFLIIIRFGRDLKKQPLVKEIRKSKAYIQLARYSGNSRARVAAVALVCLFASLYFGGFSLGRDVYVDGKKIGTVHSQGQYKAVLSKLNSDIKEISGQDSDINPPVSFVFSMVSKNGYSTEKALGEKLKGYSKQFIDCFAVDVDGNAVAALKDEQSANNVLNMLKQRYTAGKQGVTAQFLNSVEVKKQHVPVFLYMSEELALSKLAGTEQVDGIYEVKGKDTLWGISRTFGMTVETLIAINPGVTETIKDGQRLNVKEPKPLINIKTIEKAAYEEAIPCIVKQVEDGSIYKGKTNVAKSGKDGLQQVEAEIVKLNGIETARTVLSTSVISQPEEKVLLVGTKPIPKGVGSGKFARPYYGTITSRFGSRWGSRHTGLDIGGNTGDPIHASDDGKVTFVGWYGGYGNLVVVNHNNGYETWYGHMSKFKVSQGDTVAKGDTLGLIGSTGQSTGPHVHFEVRKNGNPVNPLDYLK